MSIADLRRDYARASLNITDIAADPIEQCRTWLDQAIAAELKEPTAMTLATATVDGRPSARVVLLKGLDARGFVFFTDHRSRKGRELDANPRAALVLYWSELERQIRVTGTVDHVAEWESAEYFQSRPRGSRLAAWTSTQSAPIAAEREALEQQYADVERRFEGGDVPLPPHWGGFRVTPEDIEFWQGRRSRLHDRIHVWRETPASAWQMERLAP